MLIVFTVVDGFINNLTQELRLDPVNDNTFYRQFKGESLTPEQLRRFAGQYFWFCKSFIKVLVGLIYNTPDSEQEVRLELIKTLYSEMGYGRMEAVHLTLLRRFTKALGLDEKELDAIVPIPEVKQYIEELGEIFLRADYREAIGAEFGVEITAAPEFTYLYPGVQKYAFLSAQDILFFKFHLAEEQNHGDWLTAAVVKLASTEENRKFIRRGALRAADLWGTFWEGMEKYVFEGRNEP